MSTTAPLPPPAGDPTVAPAALADAGTDYLHYARSGDAAALERALHGCADRVTTQARRLLGNAADADDAVQEAFLQLTRTARRYDGRVPFAAWVGRLVHTACLRVRRSDRRRRRREASAMTPLQISDPTPDDGTQEVVRSAIARLPAGDQSAIDLHYFAGLSQAETAAALGTSENALAQRLVRARERLRRLLAGHGTSLSVAALATLLANQPAHAASPAVLATAHSLASAVASGTALPATAIHLTWSQKGLLFMSAHPVAAVSCGALLVALGCTPLALWAADAKPADPAPVADPAPIVVEQGNGFWNPAAREVLRWLDPQAPLHVALDIGAWQQRASTLKPLSLFTDPQAAPAFTRLRTALLAREQGQGSRDFWTALSNLLAQSDAAALSVAAHERWLQAFTVPQAATAALGAQLRDTLANSPGLHPAAEAGTPGWEINDPPWTPQLWAGMHGRTFAFGVPDAVHSGQQRTEQPAAMALPPAPPAGFWLHADLGPLIAAYTAADAEAAADGLQTNLEKLAGLLGAQWRSAKPQGTVTLSCRDGVLESDTRISGGVPFSPFNIGYLLAEPLGVSLPLAPLTEGGLRQIDPQRIVAPRGSALAWLALGCKTEAFPTLAADVQHELGDTPGVQALVETLSGDLSLLVEPGAPLPACTLALGLRSRPDAALLATLAAGYGLSAATLSPELQAAGVSALWQGFTPLGQVQLLLTGQRLVLTTAADVLPILTTKATQPEAPLVVDLDLPRLTTLYGPLLLSQLHLPLGNGTTLDAGCIPPLAVLARHLAPWHAAWNPTADGCTIHERGLPILGAEVTFAAIYICGTSDPAAEVQALRTRREWSRECTAQAERMQALGTLAARMAEGGPFTAADRAAMRPWFAGREPSDAELSALGTHYDQPGDAVNFTVQDLVPGTVVLPDGRVSAILLKRSDGTNQDWSAGVLTWAAPLGDGWCIGIVNRGDVGLFKGAPPTTNVRQSPKSTF